MFLNGVEIEDTFAEAFSMYAARVTITAVSEQWARKAAAAATGFATSVIGCGIEAGVEGPASDTPDGRPGVDCLFFAPRREDLEKHLLLRIGQAVMTAPTTACFDGLSKEPNRVNVGGRLRFFGDGFQASKVIGGRRFWRIPVMEGEFLVDEEFGVVRGVGGGNFILMARSVETALEAAEAAVAALTPVRGVIAPFPGGIVRSGSKVGSRYKFLSASTNERLCPTLRGRVELTLVPKEANAVLEIVLDGLSLEAVLEAMRLGITAACREGVVRITAGNYGGKLGKYQIRLRDVMEQ
ncbi:MAG: formylmethanofuran--tetrahydromethanopterin N-formyltransferase [Clostridia bacterium]|nr:formylmethanofuran--tetrahydromethanopterin N-formyltransferase [Clostridia bacterium]MDH7572307.1 formylmethanofuran--tetrahydromethanopterin N-formyltransferase [Clostridia bacterium]